MGETVKTRDREVAEILQETLEAVRYLTDEHGSRTDVVLSLDRWIRLIAWLEALDDRLALEEWLPVLRCGPRQTGALPWRDVADEWLSEDDLFIEAEAHERRKRLPGNFRQRIGRTIESLGQSPRPSTSEPLDVSGLNAPLGIELRRIRLDPW